VKIRLSLSLDIKRSTPPEPDGPKGDTYADLERADYTRGPQIGFTREEPHWEDKHK